MRETPLEKVVEDITDIPLVLKMSTMTLILNLVLSSTRGDGGTTHVIDLILTAYISTADMSLTPMV